MILSRDQILDAALSLPPEDREIIGEKLLQSIDDAAEISDEDLLEIGRRNQEIDDGTADLIDGDEVFAAARARLRARNRE